MLVQFMLWLYVAPRANVFAAIPSFDGNWTLRLLDSSPTVWSGRHSSKFFRTQSSKSCEVTLWQCVHGQQQVTCNDRAHAHGHQHITHIYRPCIRMVSNTVLLTNVIFRGA